MEGRREMGEERRKKKKKRRKTEKSVFLTSIKIIHSNRKQTDFSDSVTRLQN